jgi:hypothetical protein
METVLREDSADGTAPEITASGRILKRKSLELDDEMVRLKMYYVSSLQA